MDYPLFAEALQYVREVNSDIAVAADGQEIYHHFCQALTQYRKGNIDSSIVIATVKKLFCNHPNLLHGFNHFVPRHQSAASASAENSCAEFLNRARLRSCVDFLNRVGTRFDGRGAYCEFLECMHAYSRGEITAKGVCEKVAELFRENDDLIREFASFLPESSAWKGLGKRKVDQTAQWGTKRRRDSSSGGRGDKAPLRPTLEKSRDDELKAARRAMERDNDMEDALCAIDVKIGRLGSATRSADYLCRSISDGRLSPANVRLDEHFTPLDLVCIRKVGWKVPESMDRDVVPALMLELIEVLTKKKVELERERVKIVKKWNRIRQSQ